MHEDKKTSTESGPHSVQQKTSAHEAALRNLREKIKSVREGWLTGGYCQTEALHVEEKKLWTLLSRDLEAAKQKHGYSPDPKFKHAEIRALELEINGLSWKPELVVKEG